MPIVGTSEDTPKAGTSSKPRGRPPENRAAAPSGPVLHWDNNRIISLFHLKHETHSVYFVEAKNKDHIHSGWVKVQESFNVIYDSAVSIDQLRNGYQRYLREYRKFVSVSLAETGNSKAQQKPGWFDELHGLLSGKLGLAAASFGSSKDSDTEDLNERIQGAQLLLLENLSDQSTDEEDIGHRIANKDVVPTVAIANKSPGCPTHKGSQGTDRGQALEKRASKMNLELFGLKEPKRKRTSASSSTACENGESDLVEPFEPKKKKADLPSAVAAVGLGISDGMNGMAASFGKIAEALKVGTVSSDNSGVLRAVEELTGEIRENQKEQNEINSKLLD
ncbi:UNVERIFIED_CONTAM: hypothetical protein HDU68_005327, partial [Siphonaria sp. JEL0065]